MRGRGGPTGAIKNDGAWGPPFLRPDRVITVRGIAYGAVATTGAQIAVVVTVTGTPLE